MTREAAAYFDHALDLFRQAQGGGAPCPAQSFRIAGTVIEMRFAGEGMAGHMAQALGHLGTAPVAAPDLLLHVWDSAGTSSPLLQPHWNAEDCDRHGLIRGFNDERYRIAMQFNPRIMRGLDRKQGLGFYWTRSAQELPYYERGTPLRLLLHDWLQGHGLLPIHGGAVGFAGGGVLMTGPSGSGKSNAALSCLDSPLRYVSDDFCVLSRDPWTVHSLYSSGKVNADSLQRLPHLKDSISNPAALDSEKALFFLQRHFADRLIGGFPLRAILLPRISPGERSRLLPVDGASAHRALAIGTIDLLPSATADIFVQTAALVRALPCYELRVGEHGPGVAELVMELLAGLGVPGP